MLGAWPGAELELEPEAIPSFLSLSVVVVVVVDAGVDFVAEVELQPEFEVGFGLENEAEVGLGAVLGVETGLAVDGVAAEAAVEAGSEAAGHDPASEGQLP